MRFISAFIGLTFSLFFAANSFAEPEAFQPGAKGSLGPARSQVMTDCIPATSGAYLKLCERFQTEDGTIRCMKAGRNRHFDTCALDLCRRFRTENGAIGCLEASRDKRFQTEEVKICGRFTTEKGAIGCMEASGESILDPFKGEVIERVEEAIYLLEDEKFYRAERRLKDLIDWLEANR